MKWIPLYQAAPLLGYAYSTLFKWIKRSEDSPGFYPPELEARLDCHYKYNRKRVILLNMSLDITPAITPRFLKTLRQYGIARRGGESELKVILKRFLNYVPPPQKEKMVYCPHAAVTMPYSKCLQCWVFKDFDFKPAQEEKPDGFTINHCLNGYTAQTYPREEILCAL